MGGINLIYKRDPIVSGMAIKHLRRFIAFALLCLVTLLHSGCTQYTETDSEVGKSVALCINDEFSAYPEVLPQILPDYMIEDTKYYPFQRLRNGQVAEAFDAHAVSALETGVAKYWHPQYLATVVIAIDRDLTNAQINGWRDLSGTGEIVGFFGLSHFSYEILLSAISYGLEGDGYSLNGAADLLAELNAQGCLNPNSHEPPILICYDYVAVNLNKSGRNLEIIVPAEGTLTCERGLLSTSEIVFTGNAEATLLSSGFRLLDGRCNTHFYPDPKSYENARGIMDYAHFNAVSYDAARIMRRDVLGIRLYSSADTREHQYWVLLYIMLVVIWIISIINRAVQRGVRRAAFYTGIMLIGWIIARLISYQLDNTSTFNLTFWYSYYIFQLALPLVILSLAWSLDKPEDSAALPKWLRAVCLVNGILLSLVLTNNLHHLVFIPNMADPKWGITFTYTYGFLLYLVQAGCWVPLVVGIIMLLHKGWSGLRRGGVLFVLALFGLLVAYAGGYLLRIPIAWESDFSMTVGIFILLLFEACIRSGIIPVNSKYARLFVHSPLSMQIINWDGSVVLCSKYAEMNDRTICSNSSAPSQLPLQYDETTLLFSNEISGGYVHWKEDISTIVRLHREIEESVRKQKAANEVLAKEEAIQRAVSEEISRTQLMGQLEDKIAGNIARLNTMMGQLGDAEKQPEAAARVTLLLAYIKRRCNLFFRERETGGCEVDELTTYLDELMEMVGYSGVEVLLTGERRGSIPVRRATVLYDFFYYMLDWAAQLTDLRILAYLGYEGGCIVLRMLPSRGTHSFQLDASVHAAIRSQAGSYMVKELDSDIVGISLSFPEGGARDG